jgi:hypothetical protein
MSEMDIKRKTRDIPTWKKHLFLDISSTNNDTLVSLPLSPPQIPHELKWDRNQATTVGSQRLTA